MALKIQSTVGEMGCFSMILLKERNNKTLILNQYIKVFRQQRDFFIVPIR